MKLPARKESIISLLLSFPLGFLRGKRDYPLRIMSAMTSHDPFPFSSSTPSTSSSNLFNHTSIQHLQTHSSPPRPIYGNSIPPAQSTKKNKKKQKEKLPPSILQIPTIPPRIFTLRSITRFIMFRQPQSPHLSTIRRTPLLPIRRPLFCISTKFITGAIESFFGYVVLNKLFCAAGEDVVGYVLAG